MQKLIAQHPKIPLNFYTITLHNNSNRTQAVLQAAGFNSNSYIKDARSSMVLGVFESFNKNSWYTFLSYLAQASEIPHDALSINNAPISTAKQRVYNCKVLKMLIFQFAADEATLY